MLFHSGDSYFLVIKIYCPLIFKLLTALSIIGAPLSSIRGFGRTVSGELKGLQNDYKTALKELGKAAGAVAASPKTVAHALATMFNHGVLTTGAPFLSSSPKLSFNRPYLNGVIVKPTNKASLLKGVAKFTPLPSSV